LTSSVTSNCNIGLPTGLPSVLGTVSSAFSTSNRYSRNLLRVERMVHAVLTSRALLHIRDQAGDSPVWSNGLIQLNTIRFHESGTDS
jgi:hypothetical protein